MIWDGSCHFCGLWIERWRSNVGNAVDFATSQEVAERFKEIPKSEFERSVVFVRPDGAVFTGAEAVSRSLAYRRSKRWLEWSYDHIPGVAAVSEFCYGVIARNRTFASALTRLFWGRNARAPTYFWARRWFLRFLGLIYLIAFVSLWTQVDGLIGENGILPVSQFLPAAQEQLGHHAYSLLPTLCWLSWSNAFLHFLCGGGALLSLLLIAGIARHCGPDLPWFSMGHPAARNRISLHLFGAVAAWIRKSLFVRAGIASWLVLAETVALQAHADVWRREIDEWRRLLVEPHGA
jgi:predicted DCC family thiol-disulfide oxidoreductase YuxK